MWARRESCVSIQYPTSRTIILLIAGQDRRYLHVIGANNAFAIDQISHQWLSSLKVFYLGGLFALPGIDFSQLAALLAFCRETNVKTVVDVVVPQGQAEAGAVEAAVTAHRCVPAQ